MGRAALASAGRYDPALIAELHLRLFRELLPGRERRGYRMRTAVRARCLPRGGRLPVLGGHRGRRGRLWVDDLDLALPFLEELVGAEPDISFAFDQVRAAAIGHFLVIPLPADERVNYPGSATLVVSDLDEPKASLTEHGGVITVPKTTAPTGGFLYARDGAEMEYVEWKPEPARRILG